MLKTWLSAAMLCTISIAGMAQQKTTGKPAVKPSAAARSSSTALAKKTNLRFRSTWGIYLSDSIPRTEILKNLDQQLVVRDQQNNKYDVVSFEFTYEQKTPYINDSTRQPATYTEFTGDNFKNTARLADIWINKLRESLQRGDELFFSNIVVKYAPDKYYQVPDLHFLVR